MIGVEGCAMNTRNLRVTADRHGRVCSLTVAGELDVTSADTFLQYAVQAVDDQTERLVLHLAGLRFVDCRGAQALHAAALAAPVGCPVIVRAISRPVRRVLDLLGLDLEDRCGEAGPPFAYAADDVVLRARWTRSRWREAAARAERVAEAIAATEDKVAVTLISVAAQRPREADRLLALSETARNHALRSRRWAAAYRPPRPLSRSG
jgi:anti-anti-sigma factor